MRFQCFSLIAVLACVACGSSTSNPGRPGTSEGTPAEEGAPAAEEGSGNQPAEPPADKCGAAPKRSGCKVDASWIRGVAHWDPSHFKAGSKPVLRAVLRHSFIVSK